ncbi:MAG TPA: SRPBCC domain-containing protein [Trichocoleus sp.]
MPSFYAEIDINAPRFEVWDALIHKEEWHRWNTFLYDVDAKTPFRQGREVLLSLRRLEGEDKNEFQPTITLIQPERCLRLISKVPGLKTEHVFELEDLGPNRTKYIHQERISGIFSRIFLPFIREEEKQGLRRMARQLKRYVEDRYHRSW